MLLMLVALEFLMVDRREKLQWKEYKFYFSTRLNGKLEYKKETLKLKTCLVNWKI